MIVTQATLDAVRKGLRAIFDEQLNAGQPLWNRFAMRTESANAEEVYGWLGAIPGMRELVDEIQIRNLAEHSFAIRNREFESTVGIKQAQLERDRLGIYTPLVRGMADAGNQHKDELLADLLASGFTATCYTGSPFFHTAHKPKAKGTAFSNKLTKVLTATHFRTARKMIKEIKNSEGRPIGNGRDLVLVVPPALEGTARDILLADRNANGATNTDAGTARLEVWPQLSANSDAQWFLLEVGRPIKPFIVQVEKEVDTNMVTDLNDSHVIKHKEFLFQAYGRYNAGFGLPEMAIGSTGADA
jgi:phage major head subunit gpT-like protein